MESEMTCASTALIVLFGLVVMNPEVSSIVIKQSKEIVFISFKQFKIVLGHSAPGVFLFTESFTLAYSKICKKVINMVESQNLAEILTKGCTFKKL